MHTDYEASAPLRIELLGGLRLIRDGQIAARFRTQKAANLLAYLALHLGQMLPRERIIDLFWSEMETDIARDNLSTTLTALRRQLEPPGGVLLADRSLIGLNIRAVKTDLQDRARLLKAAHGAEPKSRAWLLEQAVRLYRGDLLPACYEDWAVPEQQRLHHEQVEILSTLSNLHEMLGDNEGSVEAARRLTHLEPFDHAAQERLMRLLIAAGRPAEARAVYDAFQKRWERDTHERFPESLLHLAAALPESGVPPFPPCQSRRTEPLPARTRPFLPLRLTRFFGREIERGQIADLLVSGNQRLLTVTGPGGVGKTRLCAEVGERVTNAFGGRICFVPLTEISEPGRLLDALASALKIPPDTRVSPEEQIISFLCDERWLCILDSLERFLPPGGDASGTHPTQRMIAELLRRASGLSLLCATRRAIEVHGEQRYPLSPLPLPSGAADITSLAQCPSVALFVNRAQTVRPDFQLTPGNADAVVEICHMCEGMPLALEKSAVWVRTLPPHAMRDRMRQRTSPRLTTASEP